MIAALTGQLASTNSISTTVDSGNHYVLILASGKYQSNIWILDTGATRHICNNISMFTELKRVIGTRVRLPNNMLIQVESQGSIQINDHILLKNVLYVPQFELNLVSISQLVMNKTVKASFYHNHAVLKQIIAKKQIGIANTEAGLYLLQDVFEEKVRVHEVHAAVSFQQWHKRLGHTAAEKIKSISSSLHLNKVDEKHICTICPLAKQKRLSFKSANNVAKIPFELIHCDLWGPYHLPDHKENRYFVTIVDDCTRFTWT